MNTNLLFHQICPYIRYAQILKIHSSTQFSFFKAYDCRFFYCLEGVGTICIEDTYYPMTKGTLLLWQSNTKYHLISQEANSISLIGFNFDFTQNHRVKNTPIPPDNFDKFDVTSVLEQIHFTDITALNQPIYLKNMQDIENDLINIRNEYISKRKFFEEKMSGIFLSVLSTIVRLATTTIQNENGGGKIDMILRYIHTHYNSELSNQTVGEIFNYHPNYINRLIKLHTGVSLHQYVLNYRITKALNLIQTTSMCISEIGNKVGFHDFTHFSKYFKKKFGRNPTAFRYAHNQNFL